MQALYATLVDLQKKVDAESLARAEIQYSEPFIKLNQEIELAKAAQESMLSAVTDSREELQKAKDALKDAMKAQNLTAYQNAVAKFKERKEVNQSRLLHVLGGDMDAYIAMSNVTQVALKDFAKKDPRKNELLDCIEITARELVDLEILPQQ